MRLFFSTILTLFVSVTSFAVTTINIHVTDKDGNPVPNAKVEVKGVVPWDKLDFEEKCGAYFLDCLAEKGIYTQDKIWYDQYAYLIKPSFDTENESVSGAEQWEEYFEKIYSELNDCGYFEYLNTWGELLKKNEGRFKYEEIETDVKTDANGKARIKVDGYAEYRVAVQGAVRFFKDSLENIDMKVKAGEEIYMVMPIDIDDILHNTINRKDLILYVVKADPYLDIRKCFPYNDGYLQPEDILKYYPEIHDVRVWSKDDFSKKLLNFNYYRFADIPNKVGEERALFLYLEQGEYHFILSSADGDIFVDDLNTRTASRLEWRFVWEKLPDKRWLLYYYIDVLKYSPKTPPPPPDNIQIPTVITPYTQDGLNDDFLPGYEVEIFDYYGNFVSSSANGWDGRKGSDLAPPGIYFYKVKLKDGRKRKGTVEVIKM
ncbi:MAG: gliding motility-associated C-terminal domain-containing protein [Paludibacteraceae bacterium]|nr:gliding motility-associated C-terminal domain-containing protein [Paludibacteraceae bacterium]